MAEKLRGAALISHLERENAQLKEQVEELKQEKEAIQAGPVSILRHAELVDALRSASILTHKKLHDGHYDNCDDPLCKMARQSWEAIGGIEGFQEAKQGKPIEIVEPKEDDEEEPAPEPEPEPKGVRPYTGEKPEGAPEMVVKPNPEGPPEKETFPVNWEKIEEE